MTGAESRRAVERARGTQDAWPAEAQALARVRARLEETFASFGYRRIEVPVIEPAELHLRKSGLDIVSKLYAFEDQGGRQLCLRPELTASVVRAFIAHPPARLPVRLFSTGAVFRYERPSRGRYRQFAHSGVELIGAQGVLADAEVILLAAQALDALGLRGYTITLGHFGVLNELLTSLGVTGRLRSFLLESAEEARRRGTAAVRERLVGLDPELFEGDPHPGPLPEGEGDLRAAVRVMVRMAGVEGLGRREESDVVERMVRKLAGRSQAQAVERALAVLERLGALRGEADDVLSGGRELLAEFDLSDEPLSSLAETRDYLDQLGLPATRLTLDLGLNRGLQYYTGMVFEIDHEGLGSERQLCGGGRYDDLVRALGGRQPTPALGFAFGVERVALALKSEGTELEGDEAGEIFVLAATPEQVAAAGRAAQALRAGGLRARLDVSGRPLRTGMQFHQVIDGKIDIGITGFDQLQEVRGEGDDVILLHDSLGFSVGELVVAVPDSWIDVSTMADLADVSTEMRERGEQLRVATSFPNLSKRFFYASGMTQFSFVELKGGVEAAPGIGFADVVVDITSTGTSLRENRLRALKNGVVTRFQACLIGNRRALAASAEKRELVRRILELVEARLRAQAYNSITANLRAASEDDVAGALTRSPATRGRRGPTVARVYVNTPGKAGEDGADEERWYAATVIAGAGELQEAIDHLRAVGGSGISVVPLRYLFDECSQRYEAMLAELGVK